VNPVSRLLILALITGAFSAVSLAQVKSGGPATSDRPPADLKSEMAQATVLTGKVTAVDPKAGKLTVKTKDKEVKLTTDSKTTKAALEKLKVGEMARVFEKGGKVIAASPVKANSKTGDSK